MIIKAIKNMWIQTAFAAVVATMVIGCGSGDAAPAAETNGATAPAAGTSTGKKPIVGISIPAADHGWTAGVKWWAEKEMKEHPEIEFVLDTAETPDKQVASIDGMLTKKVDALVILATESAPLTPKAQEVHDRGVWIVNVDRGFLKPVADLYLQGDNKAFGRISAEYVAKKMGGKGNLLILEGIPCTVNTDRVSAAKEVFAKFPGIKILDSQAANWNQQKAFEVSQALLVKHKQVDAIWAQDDDMAIGVEKALKEAGRDKNIWILGGAGMKDIVKRVMDGDPLFPADVTYPPSMIAEGIKAAVERVKSGKKPERGAGFKQEDKILTIDLIEKDNAKKFYFPDSVY